MVDFNVNPEGAHQVQDTQIMMAQHHSAVKKHGITVQQPADKDKGDKNRRKNSRHADTSPRDTGHGRDFMNGQRGGRHQRDQDASPDEAGVRNKKHSRADSVREPRFSSGA